MLTARILLLSFGLFSRLCSTTPLHQMENTCRHPFYVSVTQIQENTKEKIVEITCKIFTDDFEKDLRKNFNTQAGLLNRADKPAMEKLVNDYIKTHLQISVDGKPCLLQYIGYEQDEEAVDCYFQVNDITVNKTVAIINNIQVDYNPEQVNIVHVTVLTSGKEKLVSLSYEPFSGANYNGWMVHYEVEDMDAPNRGNAEFLMVRNTDAWFYKKTGGKKDILTQVSFSEPGLPEEVHLAEEIRFKALYFIKNVKFAD